MKTKNFISMLLLGLFLTSCGAGTASDTSTAQNTDADGDSALSSTENDVKPVSGVPAGTTFGGDSVNIWYSGVNGTTATYTDLAGDNEGDTVDSAVYNANLKLQERLNVKLNFTNSGVAPGETGKNVQKLIMSDDTTYDLFSFVQHTGASLCASGLYYNVMNSKYLSLDKPWWDYDYMKAMTVGDDRLYVLVGDCMTDRTRFTSCLFYNKQLFSQFYDDADLLYNTVLDGKWTLDKLTEYVSACYLDADNSGTIDENDTVGLSLNYYNGNHIDILANGCDSPITSRDENDVPTLCYMSERTVSIVEKLYHLVFETGTYSNENSTLVNKQFIDGKSLFLLGNFYTAEALRDMKDDFGILPIPKYDEKQASYVSTVHNSLRDFALPSNCTKPETVCAVLEELAYLGYTEVLPIYYESSLKVKYTRDELSAQMIDLISANKYVDFAYIYATYCSEISVLPRLLIQKKSMDFSSQYESLKPKAEKSMRTLIDQFLGEE